MTRRNTGCDPDSPHHGMSRIASLRAPRRAGGNDMNACASWSWITSGSTGVERLLPAGDESLTARGEQVVRVEQRFMTQQRDLGVYSQARVRSAWARSIDTPATWAQSISVVSSSASLIMNKGTPISPANAKAVIVLPVIGGPTRSSSRCSVKRRA